MNTSFDFLEYASNGHYLLPLCVVRFKLPSGDFESVVTNLPSHDFPPEKLRQLYNRRWGIETAFRTLKYTVGLTKFHAKKASFILQEIWARLISFNFTCAVMDCVTIPEKITKHIPRFLFCYEVRFIERLRLFWHYVCYRARESGNVITILL